MKDEAAAENYLQKSLDLNPRSEVSDNVRQMLVQLKGEL